MRCAGSLLALNSSDMGYAGGVRPVFFKGDLQIVLTNVRAQVACDWGYGGKGFRDMWLLISIYF